MAKNSVKTNGDANVSTPSTVSTADDKKRQSSKSLYVNASGETSRSPTPDTAIVRFLFEGIPEPVDLTLADLPDDITHLAICQGVNIKLQRSYNTAKGNVSQMRDECEATRDNLLGGIWTSEREGGLRIGDLADAIASVLKDEGQSVDEARMASIREKLVDEKQRDKAKASTKVQAHLTRILAEKATARAAAAAGSVSQSEATLDF